MGCSRCGNNNINPTHMVPPTNGPRPGTQVPRPPVAAQKPCTSSLNDGVRQAINNLKYTPK